MYCMEIIAVLNSRPIAKISDLSLESARKQRDLIIKDGFFTVDKNDYEVIYPVSSIQKIIIKKD